MKMQYSAASLAESAFYITYKGVYDYAVLVLDVAAPTAMLARLGVSNTSLADAVSNVATVATGGAAVTMEHVRRLINLHSATTASHVVKEEDFQCELLHCRGNDLFYHASVTPIVADTGTVNLKAGWAELGVWDNDATGVGFVTLRVPHPGVSKGEILVRAISGLTALSATTATDTVTRDVTNGAGDRTVFTTGSVANATAALLAKDFLEPVGLGARGPIVLRDAVTNDVANCDFTSLAVVWGLNNQNV